MGLGIAGTVTAGIRSKWTVGFAVAACGKPIVATEGCYRLGGQYRGTYVPF